MTNLLMKSDFGAHDKSKADCNGTVVTILFHLCQTETEFLNSLKIIEKDLKNIISNSGNITIDKIQPNFESLTLRVPPHK